jgi:hypothetical protein
MDYSPLAQPCANDFAKGGMYSKDNTVSRMEVRRCPSRRCPSACLPACATMLLTLSDARVPNSTCGRGCTRASKGATTRSGKCPAMATPERGARLLQPRRAGVRDAGPRALSLPPPCDSGSSGGGGEGGGSSVIYRRRSHVCWSAVIEHMPRLGPGCTECHGTVPRYGGTPLPYLCTVGVYI